ncbi:Uncharacterised protein [Vibrio cholerae]|nr:Uncharacterised protein [Vibrio cholerae]
MQHLRHIGVHTSSFPCRENYRTEFHLLST